MKNLYQVLILIFGLVWGTAVAQEPEVELEDLNLTEAQEDKITPSEEEAEDFPGPAPEDVSSEEYTMWADDMRDWLYRVSHGTVVWADTRFVDETKQEVVETPPSRFRIGALASIELKPEGKIKFAPDADFGADVDLPNLEERLKLYVTTRDPTALPGTDAFDQDADLRVGLSRGHLKNWKTSVGVKTKWPPEVFAFLEWGPRYDLGSLWDMYPNYKIFWESEDKFGTSAALTFNRWRGRNLFRQSFSGKWTQRDAEKDQDRAEDPEDLQFGDDGGGLRWQSTTIIGYVPLLLDERDYGRSVGGDDVAKGFGLRAQVQGNQVKTRRVTSTLFYKRPIYKDFLYMILAPEVIWEEEESWNEEYVLKTGIEMLIWGDDPLLDFE